MNDGSLLYDERCLWHWHIYSFVAFAPYPSLTPALKPSCTLHTIASSSYMPSEKALTVADKPSCYSPVSSEISMLYTFLPTVVKSRLPVLTSLRRFTRMTTTRRSTPSHSRLPSEDSLHGFTSPNNAYISPNNEIVTREQLWQISRSPRDANPELMAPSISSSAVSSQMAAASLDRGLTVPIHETKTGVEWDTAVTALMLLSKACTRAQQPDMKPENTRALIVDATKWLLRSLPYDLNSAELEVIEEVLPTRLDNPDRISRRQARILSAASRPEKRSWLRRAIAFAILQVSIFIALIIPHLTALVNSCYRLERRHHVTERFLTGGIDITNIVGESGMEVKDAMFRFGQGRLANAIVHTGGWIFESIIGGLSDGAGEGVAIVGEAMLSRAGQRLQ